MRNKCPNYVANDRLAEEYILQIEILSDGVDAETVDGGVCFHLPHADVTLFECDHCSIKTHCLHWQEQRAA